MNPCYSLAIIMYKITAALESYEVAMILNVALLYFTVYNISSQDPICVSWLAVQTAMFLAPVWLSQ